MNEIEKKYFDAFMDYFDGRATTDKKAYYEGTLPYDGIDFLIESQKPLAIYVVDFMITLNTPSSCINLVVEIDGHEAHKTKEQRYEDYRRERFLLKEGYGVIRFTGSEVYVDAQKCVEETVEHIRRIIRQNVWYRKDGVNLLKAFKGDFERTIGFIELEEDFI